MLWALIKARLNLGDWFHRSSLKQGYSYTAKKISEIIRYIPQAELDAEAIDTTRLPARYAEFLDGKTAKDAAGNQALDPSRPVVDTSGRSSAIPDSVLEAGFAMADCARLLGMTEFAVVTLIAGDGLRVKDAAFRLTGRGDPPAVTATGKTLKSGLQKLAVYWGLAGGSAAQQQLSEWLSFTGPKGVIHSREKISALVSGIGDGGR